MSFKLYKLILRILVLSLIGSTDKGSAQTVQTLDLTAHSFETEGATPLDLVWSVYWGQLLTPEEIAKGEGRITHEVPQQVLTKFESIPDKDSILRYGTATFHSRLKVMPTEEPLAISVPRLGPAYRLYVNGRLEAALGVVGSARDVSRSSWGTVIITLERGITDVDLVFQMSSFQGMPMGPYRSLEMGTHSKLNAKGYQQMIADGFLVGAIIVMSFYHFALFLIRRSEPAALYFSLYCLLIGARTVVLSDGLQLYIYAQFGGIDFRYGSRLEYYGFILGVMLFYGFLKQLYPRELPNWFGPITLSLFAAFATLISVAPASVYQMFLPVFQLSAVGAASIALGGIGLAVMRGREGARLFLVGFVAIFATMINDILYTQRIISSFHSISLGMFTFVLLQSIILSKRFAKAFERVQTAEREIRALNDDLEQKVLERTQTIRTILDNVRSGFLMIDPKLRIMDGFTKSCYELMGSQMKPGLKLSEFFHFSERDRAHFELSLRQVFDDLMPEDVALGQIPDRLQQGQKSLSLQGSVVRPGSGRPPIALLLTISDATQLVKAESEASQNKSLLKIISEKVSFRAFVKDSLQSLESCVQMIKNRNYREVAMTLHTLKGNFALYGLEAIAAFIHEIEEKSEPEAIDIRAIMQYVEEFVNLNSSLLGFETSDLDALSYEINHISLQQLEHDLLLTNPTRQQVQVLHGWMRDIRMVPIRELLGPIEANVDRVARALGKSIIFQMEGADLRVDPERMRRPLKSLIHALINSIDHGIEYPEERGQKDEVGKVFLRFNYDEIMNLRIEVGDDGRGLDLDLIRAKALTAGLVTKVELEQMKSDDLKRLIFHQGFSTKSNVSEFSGRGVGIAALDFAVRSLGGEIKIRSELRQGTQFLIIIPTDQTIELLSGTA